MPIPMNANEDSAELLGSVWPEHNEEDFAADAATQRGHATTAGDAASVVHTAAGKAAESFQGAGGTAFQAASSKDQGSLSTQNQLHGDAAGTLDALSQEIARHKQALNQIDTAYHTQKTAVRTAAAAGGPKALAAEPAALQSLKSQAHAQVLAASSTFKGAYEGFVTKLEATAGVANGKAAPKDSVRLVDKKSDSDDGKKDDKKGDGKDDTGSSDPKSGDGSPSSTDDTAGSSDRPADGGTSAPSSGGGGDSGAGGGDSKPATTDESGTAGGVSKAERMGHDGGAAGADLAAGTLSGVAGQPTPSTTSAQPAAPAAPVAPAGPMQPGTYASPAGYGAPAGTYGYGMPGTGMGQPVTPLAAAGNAAGQIVNQVANAMGGGGANQMPMGMNQAQMGMGGAAMPTGGGIPALIGHELSGQPGTALDQLGSQNVPGGGDVHHSVVNAVDKAFGGDGNLDTSGHHGGDHASGGDHAGGDAKPASNNHAGGDDKPAGSDHTGGGDKPDDKPAGSKPAEHSGDASPETASGTDTPKDTPASGDSSGSDGSGGGAHASNEPASDTSSSDSASAHTPGQGTPITPTAGAPSDPITTLQAGAGTMVDGLASGAHHAIDTGAAVAHDVTGTAPLTTHTSAGSSVMTSLSNDALGAAGAPAASHTPMSGAGAAAAASAAGPMMATPPMTPAPPVIGHSGVPGVATSPSVPPSPTGTPPASPAALVDRGTASPSATPVVGGGHSPSAAGGGVVAGADGFAAAVAVFPGLPRAEVTAHRMLATVRTTLGHLGSASAVGVFMREGAARWVLATADGISYVPALGAIPDVLTPLSSMSLPVGFYRQWCGYVDPTTKLLAAADAGVGTLVMVLAAQPGVSGPVPVLTQSAQQVTQLRDASALYGRNDRWRERDELSGYRPLTDADREWLARTGVDPGRYGELMGAVAAARWRNDRDAQAYREVWGQMLIAEALVAERTGHGNDVGYLMGELTKLYGE